MIKGTTAKAISIPPHLRQFVELHLSGLSKTDAWCQVRMCAKNKAANVKASKAWRGKAVQAYVAELQQRSARGGQDTIQHRQDVIQQRIELLNASLISREQALGWLQSAVVFGPKEVMAILEDEGASDAERCRANAVCQSYRQKVTRTRDGGETIITEVTMVPKLGAMAHLIEMMGWSQPHEERPDLEKASNLAGLAQRLADTTGLIEWSGKLDNVGVS